LRIENFQMRHLLSKILAILSRRVIERYRPVVVGITGSVGKSTAKEAIYAVLSRKFKVLRNKANFNQEIGAPLAILGVEPFYKNGKSFSKKIKFAFQILGKLWLAYGWPKGKYPKYLVLELAADRPGDIEYLTEITRPKIGVVTAIGEIPVHVEFYASPEDVAKEKSILVRKLPHDGLAVLNMDDQTVLGMKELTLAKIVTFGFSEKADIWASDVTYFVEENGSTIGGLSFKVHRANSFMPMRLPGTIATHQIYGVLAATAVGTSLGMNLVDISESLEKIEMPAGRMTPLKGIKNSIVIDDSYNASPTAMHAALDTLKKFGDSTIELNSGKGRKIAILGDMKELGKYEVEAHQKVGNLVGQKADILVTIGPASKFIADAAVDQMKKENVFSFDTAEEAKENIIELIQEGDIVLVKGSHSMRMEGIVKILAAPPGFEPGLRG
jgi:UDP-N-acetylmuramoyl-tripeptide--D-alanyl-D-alanine ligase